MIPLGGNLGRKSTTLSQDFEGLGFCKTKKLSEGAGRLMAKEHSDGQVRQSFFQENGTENQYRFRVRE